MWGTSVSGLGRARAWLSRQRHTRAGQRVDASGARRPGVFPHRICSSPRSVVVSAFAGSHSSRPFARLGQQGQIPGAGLSAITLLAGSRPFCGGCPRGALSPGERRVLEACRQQRPCGLAGAGRGRALVGQSRGQRARLARIYGLSWRQEREAGTDGSPTEGQVAAFDSSCLLQAQRPSGAQTGGLPLPHERGEGSGI